MQFSGCSSKEMGLNDVALMCMNEIDVPDGLKKCIWVMLHINTSLDERPD